MRGKALAFISQLSFVPRQFGVETQAMDRAKPMYQDGLAVKCGRISFVLLPVIMREFFVHHQHMVVTICFGKDTCCCYGCIDGIAFNDCLVGDPGVWCKPVAVNQDKPGFLLSWSRARCMALKEACNIFIWSISAWSTLATAQSIDSLMITSLNAYLSFSLICFESFNRGW